MFTWIVDILSVIISFFSILYLTDAIWSLAHKCLFLIISSPVFCIFVCIILIIMIIIRNQLL